MTDLVFSGGSTKGILHVGALQAIFEKDIPIGRLYGTSAGSIIAAAIACGLDFNEIQKLVFVTDFGYFLKGFWTERIYNVLFNSGLSKGTKLLKFLKKDVCGDKVFADLRYDLNVVAYCLAQNTYLIFNKKNSPNMPVALAVRASCSIPLIFSPVFWYDEKKKINRLLVDGGVSKNFPVDLVETSNYIGHLIDDPGVDYSVGYDIKKVAMGSFAAMVSGNCKESIEDAVNGGCIVTTCYQKSATDFEVDYEEKWEMLGIGYKNMLNSLNRWLGKKK